MWNFQRRIGVRQGDAPASRPDQCGMVLHAIHANSWPVQERDGNTLMLRFRNQVGTTRWFYTLSDGSVTQMRVFSHLELPVVLVPDALQRHLLNRNSVLTAAPGTRVPPPAASWNSA